MKVVTGHQAVYLPWLGLIHKASLADVFIFMDDTLYSSRKWMNRNRIKIAPDQSAWLTVPVSEKKSASRLLKDIIIDPQEEWPAAERWQTKHLASIRNAYSNAPYYKDYKDFFEWLYLENSWERLVHLNLAILRQLFVWFQIDARIEIASELNFTKNKSELILEHARRFQADLVITGINGRDYIEVDKFSAEKIGVIFQEYRHPEYRQKFNDFIPNLAFLDLLFNHGAGSREICLSNNLKREELWSAAIV